MAEGHEQVWVGIDAGKAHHWAVGVNASGEKVFSRKVVNGEDEILALMVAACEMADEVRWAVDICGRASTLLLALLIANGQSVVYVPGRTVNRMSGAYGRPKRYHRRLRHVFYMAAQTAMMRPGPSRDYYLKKRAEGLIHVQALLALPRRRVDVLRAMLRDKRPFTSAPPAPQSA
ncbi:transposase [Streptomyces sp. NBC_01092]|uniref:IS110 family transposase n=1 Tax=Streptomyces sp. NBC_01092 TaxID=2903748 RepID=UPI0038666483|nr:transposase [Streptomyces sp. NBC_01092]